VSIRKTKEKVAVPTPPKSFAHIVYRTRRFEEMLSWYTTVFGATVQYRNPALAFLTFDDEHHRFAFANLDVIRPESVEIIDKRGMVGVDHVAFESGSLRDLLENHAELKAAGILPYWCVNHGLSASLYYADPDGNQMEFSVDAFPTKDECTAYIRGPGMQANPVGVEFDPDEWLAKLRGGTLENDLLKIDLAGAVSPIRGAIMQMQ
jgi:catechol 2,3-dioxygenase-like lactoylglutathione lyase family enzyme